MEERLANEILDAANNTGARIQNGTYGVDNASFAEKLLQKQEEMR